MSKSGEMIPDPAPSNNETNYMTGHPQTIKMPVQGGDLPIGEGERVEEEKDIIETTTTLVKIFKEVAMT